MFPSQSSGNNEEQAGREGLDVALKLIVEQACLATGATGAAIALAGKDEMICRATVGATAPAAGTRFEINRGITGACVSTQEIQRCEDALNDPRVDANTSRQLGMRSLILLPLLVQGKVAGVFELFSSRPRAFSDRDEQTLIALSSRVLQKLDKAAVRTAPAPAVPIPIPSPSAPPEEVQELPAVESVPVVPRPADPEPPPVRPFLAEPTVMQPPLLEVRDISDSSAIIAPPRRDIVGIVLSAAIVVCSLLLVAVVATHPSLRKTRAGENPPAAPAIASAANTEAQDAGVRNSPPATYVAPAASTDNSSAAPARQTAATRPQPRALPPGSLQVFEKGREVFRLMPDGSTQPTAPEQPSTASHKAALVELTPEVVDRNVVYRVEPRYPQEAVALKIEGSVVLDVLIGPSGVVQSITPRSGDPLLVRAASDAVKQWRFRQQLVGGKPASMRAQVSLSFMMPR